jgi:hypothetical protein
VTNNPGKDNFLKRGEKSAKEKMTPSHMKIVGIPKKYFIG